MHIIPLPHGDIATVTCAVETWRSMQLDKVKALKEQVARGNTPPEPEPEPSAQLQDKSMVDIPDDSPQLLSTEAGLAIMDLADEMQQWVFDDNWRNMGEPDVSRFIAAVQKAQHALEPEPSAKLMDMTMAAIEVEEPRQGGTPYLPAWTTDGKYIASALDKIEARSKVKGGYSAERRELMDDEMWTVAPVCGKPGNAEHYHVLVYTPNRRKSPVQSKVFRWQKNAEAYMNEIEMRKGERAIVTRCRYYGITREGEDVQ